MNCIQLVFAVVFALFSLTGNSQGEERTGTLSSDRTLSRQEQAIETTPLHRHDSIQSINGDSTNPRRRLITFDFSQRIELKIGGGIGPKKKLPPVDTTQVISKRSSRRGNFYCSGRWDFHSEPESELDRNAKFPVVRYEMVCTGGGENAAQLFNLIEHGKPLARQGQTGTINAEVTPLENGSCDVLIVRSDNEELAEMVRQQLRDLQFTKNTSAFEVRLSFRLNR